MFLGTHTPRLDDKGRLVFPARFRDELGEVLVVAKGQERCLYVFAMPEFERLTEPLRQASLTNRSAREYSRLFFSSASEESLDKQGRLTVPPALRAYAGLTRDCAVIGTSNRAEIWDLEAWQRYSEGLEPAYAVLAEEVVPGAF